MPHFGSREAARLRTTHRGLGLRRLPRISRVLTDAHLGRSRLPVRRFALGDDGLGYRLDEPRSFEVMDAAVRAGINNFDLR